MIREAAAPSGDERCPEGLCTSSAPDFTDVSGPKLRVRSRPTLQENKASSGNGHFFRVPAVGQQTYTGRPLSVEQLPALLVGVDNNQEGLGHAPHVGLGQLRSTAQ